MSRESVLRANLERVRARIAVAARGAGRDPESIDLVAVTKHVDPTTAAELCALGQRDLGENRADELERKCAHFREQGLHARWHYIGHVQTNKARRIVALAEVIHSIDSIALLERIDAAAAELGRKPAAFVQVKLAPEARKTGLDPALVPALLERARDLPHVDIVGLMAMAPLGEPARAEAVFQACARLARDLASSPFHRRAFVAGRVRLSMGMSEDFGAAIAAGSDCVRIGSLLFEGLLLEGWEG